MDLKNRMKNGGKHELDKIIIAKETIKEIEDKNIRDFILLTLSGTVSDAFRRKKADFIEILKKRFEELYLRVFLFNELNKTLKICVGDSECYIGDTRDMKQISNNSIDAIINSPPYSTALDYVKNDAPQLITLDFFNSLKKLKWDMIGNPSLNYKKNKKLVDSLKKKDSKYNDLGQSKYAIKIVEMLKQGKRMDGALRCYKFFIDIYVSLKEMYRVLKHGGKCGIIIGNNHFKVDGKFAEVQNDRVIWELGEKIGFKVDSIITRELQKTSVGNIKYESVVIFEKP